MPITIRIGKPIRADQFGRPNDPLLLRRITDEVMFELRELSGQEYVSAYAVRKGAIAEAERARPVSVVEQNGAREPVAAAG